MGRRRTGASGANPLGASGADSGRTKEPLRPFAWYERLLETPGGRRESEIERLLFEAVENLSVLMHAQGVSQRELARRLEVSPSRVSQMLDGGRNLTLATLGEAFHVLGRSMHVTYGPLTDRVRIHEEKGRKRAKPKRARS